MALGYLLNGKNKSQGSINKNTQMSKILLFREENEANSYLTTAMISNGLHSSKTTIHTFTLMLLVTNLVNTK